MTTIAPIRFASERTVNFVRTLLAERATPEGVEIEMLESIDDGTLSQSEASALIDYLKSMPFKRAAAAIDSEGVFELDGKVYRTKKARAGHLYFQVFNFETRKYEYAAGAKRILDESHRITVERALVLSAQISSCIRCNRTLTNSVSVERGIGPICIQYFA